jgi:hypothetical protein
MFVYSTSGFKSQPCKDCTSETGRSPTCHGTCKKYLKFKKEFEKYKNEDKIRRKRERETYDYYINNRRRRK